MTSRIAFIGAAFGLVWASLVARVLYVQVVKSGHYQGVSENQSVRRDVLPPGRGEIFDRHGERLVVNLRDGSSDDRRGSRISPNGRLAGQVLGTVGRDGYGQSGLEFHLDRELRGIDGWRYSRRDHRGRLAPGAADQIHLPVDGLGVRLTLDARVQSVAEHALERGVLRTGARAGVAVVVDPRTGDLLALANYPFFDPNGRRAPDSDSWRNRAVAMVYEPGSTFKVFTAAALMEEGRIAPTDTVDGEGGAWQVGGMRIRDTHPLGRITFTEAMAYSSNIVFSKASTSIDAVTYYKYMRSFGFGMRSGVSLPAEESGLLKPVASWSGRTQQTMAFGHEISATPLQMAMAFAAIANGGVLMRPRLVKEWIDGSGRVVQEEPVRSVRRVLSEKTAEELRNMLTGVVNHGTAAGIRHPTLQIAGKTGTAEKIDPETGRYLQGRFNSSFAGMVPADQPTFVCIVILDEPEKFKYGGQAAAPVFREITDRLAEEGRWLQRHGMVVRGEVRDAEAPRPALASFRFPRFLGGGRSSEEASMARVAEASASRSPSAVAPGGMPDLRGESLRDALRSLRALGIEVEYSGEGRVTGQSPAPGARLPRGEIARLTLGWDR